MIVRGPTVAGIIPYGPLMIELYLLVGDLWSHQTYYAYGFLLLSLLLTAIVTAEARAHTRVARMSAACVVRARACAVVRRRVRVHARSCGAACACTRGQYYTWTALPSPAPRHQR